MLKYLIVLAVLCFGSTAAFNRGKFQTHSTYVHRTVPSKTLGDNPLDWCPDCINTFDYLIETILDIILQVGVVDSCGQLCDLVAEKTGSQLLGFMCTIGCDVFGIKEFVKLVEEADPDPIYYCENINLCPINDNGDCVFKSFAILPPRAKMESTITIDMELISKNGTGTGEMVLAIETVDKIPLNASFLMEAKKPGSFGQRFTIDTTPDPDCDPTTDDCEMWLEGTYNVTILMCNGECGSKHPHSAIYDVARGNFTLYEE